MLHIRKLTRMHGALMLPWQCRQRCLSASTTSFTELAKTFQAIENATPSRDERIGILADYYQHLMNEASPEELTSAVYLTRSQLAPSFEGVELRLNVKSLMPVLEGLCASHSSSDSSQTSTIVPDAVRQSTDLGAAARLLVDQGHLPPYKDSNQDQTGLSNTAVLQELREIAKEEGKGSTDRKRSRALDLLHRCRSFEEQVVLFRLLSQQNLRLGLGEKSVLSALAIASHQNPVDDAVDTSKLRQWIATVTRAYSQRPDLDALTSALYNLQHETNSERRETVLRASTRPKVGIPVLTMGANAMNSVENVVQRLSSSTSDDIVPATCEFKYDGARVQVHLSLVQNKIQVGRVFSRNLEDQTEKYASILSLLQEQTHEEDVELIVEGEVVAVDRSKVGGSHFLPFQVLQTKSTTDFCLFAFDLLLHNDSLLQHPLSDRRQTLRKVTKEASGYYELAVHQDVSSQTTAESIRHFLQASVDAGCEGLMVKTLTSTYEAGKRSYSWMKLKQDYLAPDSGNSGAFLPDTLDLVPIGAYYGKGRRAGVYGSFLLAAYNAKTNQYETIGKVGTGFSDAQLSELTRMLAQDVISSVGEKTLPEDYRVNPSAPHQPDVWFHPRNVWEVKATQLTSSRLYTCGASMEEKAKGLALRFPRFVRMREDKLVTQATNTEQILAFFHAQS